MDGGGAPKTGLRISFILLAVAIVLTVVCYVYSRPRFAETMVKDLRQYQRQTGQFPADFEELERQVWRHTNVSDFGPAKRTLTVANYYYMYSKVDAFTCAV